MDSFPKAFVEIPTWVKYNETLTTTETYMKRYIRPLPNQGNIYVGSPWETEKTYILKYLTISDVVNLLVLFIRYSYSNAVTTRLNLKSYCDIDDARRIIVMDNDLTDLNIEWPSKDIQGIVHALKTDFSELQIKEYHGKSDPMEKAYDFSNVEES
ncbi:10655_t:CDS:2 [Funneliformis geosporum]|nr:10655_t:CDS:2 [Funneliformis geosporum]